MGKLIRFLLALSIGVAFGMLFAQKTGKKFRAELKASKEPVKHFWNEFKDMAMESKETVENSEELQRVLASGKKQFESLVKEVKEMGSDMKEKVEGELEELAHNAKSALEDLKKGASDKVHHMEKEVKLMARKLKD